MLKFEKKLQRHFDIILNLYVLTTITRTISAEVADLKKLEELPLVLYSYSYIVIAIMVLAEFCIVMAAKHTTVDKFKAECGEGLPVSSTIKSFAISEQVVCVQ